VGLNPAGDTDILCLVNVFLLSGKGLCDGPVPRTEDFDRLWCVLIACDPETSTRDGLAPSRAVAPQEENFYYRAEHAGKFLACFEDSLYLCFTQWPSYCLLFSNLSHGSLVFL
jgi:hypothetical protein